jgi:hypothetical protein
VLEEIDDYHLTIDPVTFCTSECLVYNTPTQEIMLALISNVTTLCQYTTTNGDDPVKRSDLESDQHL